MADQHALALGHLQAALAAMVACGNTLAVATIAQAISVVECGAEAAHGPSAVLGPVANHRPC